MLLKWLILTVCRWRSQNMSPDFLQHNICVHVTLSPHFLFSPYGHAAIIVHKHEFMQLKWPWKWTFPQPSLTCKYNALVYTSELHLDALSDTNGQFEYYFFEKEYAIKGRKVYKCWQVKSGLYPTLFDF